MGLEPIIMVLKTMVLPLKLFSLESLITNKDA
jgi:hypothetical protein